MSRYDQYDVEIGIKPHTDKQIKLEHCLSENLLKVIDLVCWKLMSESP